MKYEFLTPIEPPNKSECKCCGKVEIHLELDTVLRYGTHTFLITKDGERYYLSQSFNDKKCKSLLNIEIQAMHDPNHDWRCELETPLRSATYQRQNGKWVLVLTGSGYADPNFESKI